MFSYPQDARNLNFDLLTGYELRTTMQPRVRISTIYIMTNIYI
jgi:hypothetical protein